MKFNTMVIKVRYNIDLDKLTHDLIVAKQSKVHTIIIESDREISNMKRMTKIVMEALEDFEFPFIKLRDSEDSIYKLIGETNTRESREYLEDLKGLGLNGINITIDLVNYSQEKLIELNKELKDLDIKLTVESEVGYSLDLKDNMMKLTRLARNNQITQLEFNNKTADERDSYMGKSPIHCAMEYGLGGEVNVKHLNIIPDSYSRFLPMTMVIDRKDNIDLIFENNELMQNSMQAVSKLIWVYLGHEMS